MCFRLGEIARCLRPFPCFVGKLLTSFAHRRSYIVCGSLRTFA